MYVCVLNIKVIAVSLPMVDDVIEARRPNTQENGKDMAIAPECKS